MRKVSILIGLMNVQVDVVMNDPLSKITITKEACKYAAEFH